MTELPIIVTTNEVTVGGFVDTIELELETGTPGQRGSRIFSGDVPPTGLPPSHTYFGGITEFVLGDMFLVRSGVYVGDVWEYRVQPAGNDWVLVVQRTGPPTYTGTGSPNSQITAGVGALYTRTDGGTNTTLYVKESGTGNTGWVAK
jgi:hypothetical protein